MSDEQHFGAPPPPEQEPPSYPPKAQPARPRYNTEPNQIIEVEPITQLTPRIEAEIAPTPPPPPPVGQFTGGPDFTAVAPRIHTEVDVPAVESSSGTSKLSRRHKKLMITAGIVAVFFFAGIFSAFWFTSSAVAGGKSVYAWGQGLYGQLGDARTQADFEDPWAREYSPVKSDTAGMFSGHQIVQVAAGGGHSLALTEEGTIYAWGHGARGQLGNGQDYLELPEDVMPGAITAVEVDQSGVLAGKEVVQIAAGGGHSLALDADGQVYAWGFGGNGQLGNGEFEDSLVPVAVDQSGEMAGRKVVAISTLADHNLALAEDGTVFAWGRGNSGQLGNDSTEDSATPVPVTGKIAGRNITQISAGGHHSLAADADGNIYAWGSDAYGQLGDGNPVAEKEDELESSHKAPVEQPATGQSLVPVFVDLDGAPTEKKLLQIAAGGDHSVALWDNSDIYAWGSPILGPDLLTLAQGTDEFNQYTPKKVVTLAALGNEKLVAVDAGWTHSLVVSKKGKIYSWGTGWLGQLGTGESYGDPYIDTERPFGTLTPVPSFGTGSDERVAVAVSAGQNHTLVVGRD